MDTLVNYGETTVSSKAVVPVRNETSQPEARDSREDSHSTREQVSEGREGSSDIQLKTFASRSKGGNSNNNSKKGARFFPNNKMGGPGPYAMRGPPYGPPPYAFMGSSYGHPPPHFPPHMGMPYAGAPFPGGPQMKGPNYPLPPYGPGMYGMPPPYQPNGMPSSYGGIGPSDSASVSSKGSMNSKKKRTIDGVHGNAMQPSFSFRQTDSSSAASTMTTGNNTSMETNESGDSQQKRDRSGSSLAVLNIDGMVFDDKQHDKSRPHHRRDFSTASTASSLSVCGFSLASYEGQQRGHHPEDGNKNATKRQKKNERAQLVVDTDHRPLSHDADHSRFEQLSIDQKHPSSTTSAASSTSGRHIFLSLSTSPINANPDVDATPVKANTSKTNAIFKKKGPHPSNPDRPSDTPTPPVHGEMGVSDTNDDHSMLNSHLRGQSFTPLPHLASNENVSTSPTNAGFSTGIAPQLSWSIAGDTPSLGDLAEWDDEHHKLKTEQKVRPSSTTSNDTRNMAISPQDFQMWKEEHEMAEHGVHGTTTPLPVFFEQSANERSENHARGDQHPRKMENFNDVRPNITGSNSNMKGIKQEPTVAWGGRQDGNMNPIPMFNPSDYRDDMFQGRSPHHHMDRRDANMDFYQAFQHMGHGQGGPNDRIRNLRGRLHPGLPPMPLHIPPPMSGHLPMTSPMGLGPGKGLWSPHHGLPGALGSPHHMGSPLASMAQSKRKCVPLKPPIPSKFQGDIDKHKGAPVPEFTSLVNFPSHMSQKQAVNLPDGMRCCVMCGQACPCSSGNKGKNKAKNKPPDSGPQRTDHLGDKNSGYAIIPTQNKGLCTLCDVNVWVVVNTGLEIKWCKGCKNFRPWAAFGDKGLATKCLRCRERQREKYALQKEEKEKARASLVAKAESG